MSHGIEHIRIVVILARILKADYIQNTLLMQQLVFFRGVGTKKTEYGYSIAGNYKVVSSSAIYEYKYKSIDYNNQTVVLTITPYHSEENPNATYNKGTSKYGIVTSTSSLTYPKDGYQNGYYYVKTTSQ